MAAVIRTLLLFVALLVAALIIAAHGVRGVVFLIALALLATIPQTRAWRFAEGWMVRLTGSRRRAAAVAMGLVLGILVLVNIVEVVR